MEEGICQRCERKEVLIDNLCYGCRCVTDNDMNSGNFIRKHTSDSDPPEGREIAIFAAWLILTIFVIIGAMIWAWCG